MSEIGAGLWLLMTVGGAALLGLALAYGVISTRKRRQDPVAERVTEQATRELYKEEEISREREEEGTAPRQVP